MENKDKAITLKDLLARIESLEKDVVALTHIKAEIKSTPANKPPAKPADVKDLLAQLDKAKKADDKKSAFKIRRQLRAAGYSLRDANGKK